MSDAQLYAPIPDSCFARLDFRPKLALVTTLTIVAFIWESPLLGGLLALVVALACLGAGINFRYLRAPILLLLPFGLLILVTQGFFADAVIRLRTGQAALTPVFVIPESVWLVGGAAMSVEGIAYGLNILAKMLTMALLVPLLVLTTDLDAMVLGMVKIRIPYKIAFVLASTLRFFPLLLSDIRAITEAQRLRGLALERMGPIRRARIYAQLAVPLILGVIVKSQMLEVMLQSKAFTGDPARTYLHEARLGPGDWAVLMLSALLLVTAVALYLAFGIGRFGGPL
ncbi:MAG: energy-coupling factor transporter transmembrane protein EcfT [Anaerolineae bacterium]|jgi:energy-coupling factor transport system permease protein|nr:energy-coupling factor transporter transmembrane protein EcfT [Anaerolineae bacterium]